MLRRKMTKIRESPQNSSYATATEQAHDKKDGPLRELNPRPLRIMLPYDLSESDSELIKFATQTENHATRPNGPTIVQVGFRQREYIRKAKIA